MVARLNKVEFNTFFDGQPVKLMKEVCAGAVWMAPEDNAGNRILGLLQLNQVEFGDAVENGVAIVKARLNKGNFDCSGSVIGEGVADVTKSTDMIEGGLAD